MSGGGPCPQPNASPNLQCRWVWGFAHGLSKFDLSRWVSLKNSSLVEPWRSNPDEKSSATNVENARMVAKTTLEFVNHLVTSDSHIINQPFVADDLLYGQRCGTCHRMIFVRLTMDENPGAQMRGSQGPARVMTNPLFSTMAEATFLPMRTPAMGIYPPPSVLPIICISGATPISGCCHA